MAEYVLCEKTILDGIANSIRSQINSSDNMNIGDFSTNIDSIPKGENRNIKVSSDIGVFYYQTYNELGKLIWASQDYGEDINYSSTTYTLPIAKNGLIIAWKVQDHMASSDSNSLEPFMEYSKDNYQYQVYFIDNDNQYIDCLGIPM